MQTSLVRSSAAARTVLDQSPPAGVIASRNGSATVAPSPRNTVRRGRCFPVTNDILLLLSYPHVGSGVTAYHEVVMKRGAPRTMKPCLPTRCRGGPAGPPRAD